MNKIKIKIIICVLYIISNKKTALWNKEFFLLLMRIKINDSLFHQSSVDIEYNNVIIIFMITLIIRSKLEIKIIFYINS